MMQQSARWCGIYNDIHKDATRKQVFSTSGFHKFVVVCVFFFNSFLHSYTEERRPFWNLLSEADWLKFQHKQAKSGEQPNREGVSGFLQ
jgi:hypothetical protein